MMDVNEKLQDYLDGELSESEARAFVLEMEANIELRAAYENAVLAKRMAGGMLELDMREVLEKERRPAMNFRLWGAVAALLLLGLGIFLFRSMLPTEESSYAAAYVEPLWPGTRGSADDLAMALGEFRQGGDIQEAKSKVLAIEGLKQEMKSYWISEMFLLREVTDSAKLYLPAFSAEHIKYQRMLWISEFIEEQEGE